MFEDNYVPPPKGSGTYWFGVDRHTFLSAQYLVNQWLDSYQIYMAI